MRKIILVTAMVLASASAHAAPRSLSLSAPPEQASAPPATMASATTQMSEAAPATAAPNYVDRPPAVSTPASIAATPPAATTAAAPATTSKPAAKADKPKRRHSWTEGRIISELHRYGIYW